MEKRKILLMAKGVQKYFPAGNSFSSSKKRYVHAVEHVDMEIWKGETIGLVGESGCGKSTLGRLLIRMLDPSGGRVFFDGDDITTMKESELRAYRQRMQLVFQDPYASLNPRMTIMDTLSAPLRNYGIQKRECRDRVYAISEKVGINPEWMLRYPHEFSGGQRQRIVLARALILQPEFVVCDEPVSALDVSVRSQVLNLMQDMQEEMKLTYLFISHDLSVVRHISSRIVVMYLGRIVEQAPAEELMLHACHPYTQALISAIPQPEIRKEKRIAVLGGDLPSPLNPPGGCPFHQRCPYCQGICKKEMPELKDCGNGHQAACHLIT